MTNPNPTTAAILTAARTAVADAFESVAIDLEDLFADEDDKELAREMWEHEGRLLEALDTLATLLDPR